MTAAESLAPELVASMVALVLAPNERPLFAFVATRRACTGRFAVGDYRADAQVLHVLTTSLRLVAIRIEAARSGFRAVSCESTFSLRGFTSIDRGAEPRTIRIAGGPGDELELCLEERAFVAEQSSTEAVLLGLLEPGALDRLVAAAPAAYVAPALPPPAVSDSVAARNVTWLSMALVGGGLATLCACNWQMLAVSFPFLAVAFGFAYRDKRYGMLAMTVLVAAFWTYRFYRVLSHDDSPTRRANAASVSDSRTTSTHAPSASAAGASRLRTVDGAPVLEIRGRAPTDAERTAAREDATTEVVDGSESAPARAGWNAATTALRDRVTATGIDLSRCAPDATREIEHAFDLLVACRFVHDFDVETGSYPNEHDELAETLAAIAGSPLADVRFVESAPGPEARDTPYRLVAIDGDTAYEASLENLGDWYDVERTVGLLNALIAARNDPRRFFVLDPYGDQTAGVLFATPAQRAALGAAGFDRVVPLGDEP